MRDVVKESIRFMHGEEGSLTVEASLICGIILCIIVNSMNMSVIEYDKVVSKEKLISYSEDISSHNEQEIKNELNKKLYLLNVYSANISNQEELVNVSVKMSSSETPAYIKKIYKNCYSDVDVYSKGITRKRV